ncbi:DNA (cytosine-5-)-methyltransferase [Clostridium perfringens]|uniref:DNA (cytosine-5-)-methyltransferase n=1 Tax=Clostridium perfringens TaxID=1502 RepID=UPI0013E2D015|nr:DNA (cytosine-5-)-methyltransferase [Clostridium perfringens]MDK0559082.1 DNA (cytosine-5-)-methyltransferase [Clostridium perfringens]MDK0563273.1 DNA (cytosine-5-)-methyltransferase [Clostridium perfringens]MDK0904145.1 DNA (cytosine-5-)-methyltransferase [Clostridium perfringens]MDM0937049.1 DNA (cytosine-5-)-methyltransferase [Clostridium perfringens]MDM0963060.1 DNA (cytosine-5-)-methyltransferase [Clostridium perfringens]
MIKRKLRVGSLFAGVGGICLGFKQANYNDLGYELVWANEMDEYAATTYNNNFKHELIVGDIEKILNPNIIENEKEEFIELMASAKDEKEKERFRKLVEKCEFEKTLYEEKKEQILSHRIDVLNGGFPCQAFSIAGQRKGFEDHRGNLFWSVIDLIKMLEPLHGKPRVLLLENVKNLMSHDSGNTYKVIKNELEKVGYIIKEQVLNTMNFSHLPQNRERIYIVGFLDKEEADKFTMFENINDYFISKTPNERIKDIENILDSSINKEENIKYYYTKDKYPNYFIEEAQYLAMPEEERKSVRINLVEDIIEENQFYQVRRGMYVRKNMSNVCPTLTANMGTGGHNVPLIKVKDGIRKLTPKETFKLQGFPIGEGYEFPEKFNNRAYPESHLYKQSGNAVSVPIIKLIAEEILKSLK